MSRFTELDVRAIANAAAGLRVRYDHRDRGAVQLPSPQETAEGRALALQLAGELAERASVDPRTGLFEQAVRLLKTMPIEEACGWHKRLAVASGLTAAMHAQMSTEALYVISTSGFAMSTTAKTAVEIAVPAAAAGARAIPVVQWWIEFNASAAGTPITVELIRVTASTGITGTTAGVKLDDTYDSANGQTAKHSASAEGTVTSTDNIELHFIAPTAGIFVQYPLGREPSAAPASTRYWRLRGTGSSGVTPNAAFGLVWRE